MLGGAPPPDPSALLPYVATALAVVLGLVVLLRSAASRYFAVEAPFCAEEVERYEGGAQRRLRGGAMSIGSRRGGEEEASSPSEGGGRGGGARDPQCFVCGKAATKVCAGCRTVRYCSLDCQSKHWKEEHKSKCRRKVSGSAIALIPGHGSPARAALKVLRKPKKILFPYDEFVRLFYWDKEAFLPCGLLNCGNSCFANVVLQCLACTRPLAAYLLEGVHSRQCRRNDWCFLCEIQSHIQKVKSSMQPFSPMSILSHLPSISSNLGYGSQEDAHEFMRFAIDTMQSVCLDEYGGEKALDASTQETTLVQHIFGGHLQSQVICTNCKQVSNRYENMMDLTVEIQGDAECLENCLDQFTAKEWLDGENKYKCDGCNGYVKALKRLTVHRPPNILTIALKRFQSGRFGKLNKRVAFPEMLDLGPYISSTGGTTNLYSLYAIVVHLDMLNASFFGHYICYTKDFCGQWYRIDDCKVAKVDIEEVLSQGAYMLLYSRLEVRWPKTLEPAETNSSAAQVTSVSSDKTGEASSMETASEKTISSGTSDEAKMEMEIDTPQSSSSVPLCSRAPDGDFPVLQTEDAKKISPRKISNSDVNSTGSPSLENQSDEFKPLERRAESGNSSEELADSLARFEARSCRDLAPEPPVSVANGLKLGQTRTATPEDPPSDGPSVPDWKSTATSPASRGNPTSKEARPLFSRGFLDKPLKKKSLPLAKGTRIERLTHLSEINGSSNGFCEPMQIDNEKLKSELQICSVLSEGSDRNVILSREEAKDHAVNSSINCNGHLESNSWPHSDDKGGGMDPLASLTSVDKPYSHHQAENGHVRVAAKYCSSSDTNCDGVINFLPLQSTIDQTGVDLSEGT